MDTAFSHIKAVLCDLDGTLLTSEHAVSPRTVAAIRALRERGVLFGLCTGRDAQATEAMFGLWGIDGLVDVLVGCGGAEVIDRAHGINELSYPLPGETIARICEHMAGLPATPVCPRDGVLYVPESNACVEHLSRVDGVPYKVVDFAEFLREPQTKVMFTMAPEAMPRVIERASTFADDTVKAAALQTTQRLYEFMDPRVSKTRGLVRVAELNDMELQNICVFGSEYYKKAHTLILSARIGGEIIETVEVDLRTLKVVQCHGKYNQDTEYHERIIDLVNKNANLIRERMKVA